MIVVKANPRSMPAPAQKRGSIAATIVKKAPIIINKALLIFSLIPALSPDLDSSIIIIWSLTPVPMPAIIPAMLEASKFHFNNAATPKVMNASENIVKITARVILTMFSEAFITLGVAALLKWNLDASSIAGIIAGMGTGVNDQIIIIDESKSGEKAGVKERIKRALFIIMGAFFTIVAAMLPLFWAGAGMLRGFAFTTIIGI